MAGRDDVELGEPRPRLEKEECELQLEKQLGWSALGRIGPGGTGVAGNRGEGACDAGPIGRRVGNARQQLGETALGRSQALLKAGHEPALETTDRALARLQ